MKPNYEHDCDECVFLGRLEEGLEVHPDFAVGDDDWHSVFGANNKKHTDLYFCNKQKMGATVIARFSDAGHDYASGLRFADTIPQLKVAKSLAVAKGLLDE